MLASPAPAPREAQPLILHLAEVMARPPDSAGPNVRLWTLRKTDQMRTNLVEMKGKLGYHRHPDADHSIQVLEGRLAAWHGTTVVVLERGDYFSIPRGVP